MSTSYCISLSADDSVLELIMDDGASLQLRAAGHWVPVTHGDPAVFDTDIMEVSEDSVAVFDALEARKKKMSALQFRKFGI